MNNMKGIYLTEQAKQEIEAKIALYEFCNLLPHQVGEIKVYKEILESATILPVEESWGRVPMGTNECELLLPNGVIIQPKQS